MINLVGKLVVTSAMICAAHAACGILRAGKLSCQDKLNILKYHNDARQAVASGGVRGQPSASGMLEIFWDDELAAKAQKWANQCPDGHDSNKQRQVSRFGVGQNIFTSYSSSNDNNQPDFKSAVKAWFEEVSLYSFGTGFNSAWAHYTQVVWANTYLVGCGYTYYKDGGRFTKKYVCNYGPAGNILGQTPYMKGRPSCKSGSFKSRRYNALCEKQGMKNSC